MYELNDFNSIQISIASPEKIREWSYGEVTKPETINYRTQKPERDGLFCEKIFGPMKDWECHCGKYKRVKYKGHVCEKCGVEITRSKVRRERMGHIELAAPVSHIWYFKGVPSKIGLLLDMGPKQLEHVIYFACYVVLDPGEISELSAKEVINDKRLNELYDTYGDLSEKGLKLGMGAEAIRELLMAVDLDKESAEYKAQIKKQQAERDALEAEIDAYIKEHASSEGDVPEEEYGNDGELAWPVKERCTITAGYPTYPSGGKHYGIDICLCTASGSTRDSGGNSLSLGQPYYAAQGGEVIIAGWHKSFGNYVVVDHGDGRQTLYAHSSSLSVSVGDIVKKGQQLGLIGSTGNSTGPHLHFEVRYNNVPQNPLNYVKY